MLLSEYVLRELSELPSKLPERLMVTSKRVDALIAQLQVCCEFFEVVPSMYMNPFDSDDSPYFDLAIAGEAALVTSRDKHMLRLMDRNLPAGGDFYERFPNLIVVAPEELLKRLRE